MPKIQWDLKWPILLVPCRRIVKVAENLFNIFFPRKPDPNFTHAVSELRVVTQDVIENGSKDVFG
jgi:hypothetical protein